MKLAIIFFGFFSFFFKQNFMTWSFMKVPRNWCHVHIIIVDLIFMNENIKFLFKNISPPVETIN